MVSTLYGDTEPCVHSTAISLLALSQALYILI